MAWLGLLLALALAFAFSGIGGDEPDPEPDETIEGTDEDENLDGTGGRDLIDAGGGNDTVFGYGGDDTIYGGEGDDLLFGNAGDDLVDGGAGNDNLLANAGTDTLLGGDGDDNLTFASPEGGVGDGGPGNDRLVIESGNNTVNGGEGDDIFELENRDGNMLDGGDGRDVLRLGGFDRLNVVFSDNGRGTITDGPDISEFRNFEVVEVGPSNILVDASATTDGVHLRGGTLLDFGGAPTLIGGAGDDILERGFVMDGGDGDDLIIASPEGGALTGGNGDDIFESRLMVTPPGGSQTPFGTATVTDFDRDHDTLRLNIGYDPAETDEVIVTSTEENGNTQIRLNGRIAVVLQNVTGFDLDEIDLTVSAV